MTSRVVLLDRAQEAHRVATTNIARSIELVALIRSARAQRAEAHYEPPAVSFEADCIYVERRRQEDDGSFRIEGLVGERWVWATLDKTALRCDPVLFRHAELVVALGETFTYSGGRPVVADLEGSVAQVLVTLMKAMRVTDCKVSIGPS